uniref:Uncharacterized protein n=1 Tax=Panagrolaimus sp. ES5 TaxID=591445 RepID=A0AC34FIU5_9BILA
MYERTEFFKPGDYFQLINKQNNPLGGEEISFDDQTLVVNVTEAEFILVRPNDENIPFFEICGKYDPDGCNDTDRAFICHSSEEEPVDLIQVCMDNLQAISIFNDVVRFTSSNYFRLNPADETCRKFYQKTYTQGGISTPYIATSKDEGYQGATQYFPLIKSEPLPNSNNLVQIRMQVIQTYCRLPFRFPNSSIAIVAPPPPPTTVPPPTKTTFRITKPIAIVTSPQKAAVKVPNEEVQESSSPIPMIGIIFGSLAFILLLIVVAAFIIRYIIKRRKTTTYPLIPRDTQSMKSDVHPPPAPPIPPSTITALPYLDPALEEKTQELSVVISSKTQETPRTQPTQPTIDGGSKNQRIIPSRDPLKTISKSKTTEQFSKENAGAKEGSGGNVIAAAGGTVVKDEKESDSSEIPLPALAVDTTKVFTKIYKKEFDRGQEDSMASEENCGENVYKIDAFCLQHVPLPDQTMATWPPDYVENMAVRAPNIEHRGIFHYQAVIMANNLLLKKGIKNIKGKLGGSTKGMKWLKNRQNISFVQFISESIEGSPDGKGQEFLSSKIQWRRHLKKLDVVETFRQSCWLGQTKERREFFLLATFYKMELLTKQFPKEDDLKTFPFPVPMLLEVRKEAPQFFEINEDKMPAAEKKGGDAPPTTQTSQIPKFSL